MARHNKKQQPSNHYSLSSCEKRPVTKKDTWCERKGMLNGIVPSGVAPWGYVVTIPYCPNQNTYLEEVDGIIVRTKRHCGKLLLQVVEKDNSPKYGVKSTAITKKGSQNKKGRARIVGIRNLCKRKTESEWGQKMG